MPSGSNYLIEHNSRPALAWFEIDEESESKFYESSAVSDHAVVPATSLYADASCSKGSGPGYRLIGESRSRLVLDLP